MALGFRSFSSGDAHLPAATLTVTKPTGFASTDALVLFVGSGRTAITPGTWTAPSGWTAIATAVSQNGTNSGVNLAGFVAYGNVANLGFTKSGTVDDVGWVMLAFTGGDQTTIVDAAGTPNSNTAAGSITAGAVTPATTGAAYVTGLASWVGGTWSGTGFTLKQNAGANEDTSCAFDLTGLTGGVSSGTKSLSTTGGATAQILAAMPFALRPAAGGETITVDKWFSRFDVPRQSRGVVAY